MAHTVCFFSIYEKQFPRDRVLIRALEEAGWNVVRCIDATPGIGKYRAITRKHQNLWRTYDVAVIGYTSQVLIPLVCFISRKKIVFNASNSTYEAVILDRGQDRPWSILGVKTWLIDFLSFLLSDVVLVETKAQAEFIAKTFFVKGTKLVRMWASVCEEDFFEDKTIAKTSKFTVLFRGMFLPFVGVEYVIEAARILASTDIQFLVIGSGMLEFKIRQDLEQDPVPNLLLVTEFLPLAELRARMLSCHAAIAQVSCHARVERTITNKTFEYLALGLPFITAKAASNRELLVHGEHCMFVPCGDPQALARQILELRDNEYLREHLSSNARALFERELTLQAIGKELLPIFDRLARK